MAALKETPRRHAVLSASSSHRWMACTPSAVFEQQFQESASEYAEEGTFAHKLAEIKLRVVAGETTKRAATASINALKKDPFYSQELEDYVDGYVDTVIERFNAARARCKDALLLLEQRLDFSAWVPEGFGTGDVVIIAEPVAEVIDLKYGAGVPVSAICNPQARLYGLGALARFEMLYDIQQVRNTIIQPRLDNVTTEELSVPELLAWAETEVQHRAALAAQGAGEFAPGEHCRFCRARTSCRARAEHNLQLAKYEFRKGPALDDAEISDILGRIEELVNWADAVKDYALDQAVNQGKQWPGWKLVEGRSNRKYADDGKVITVLVDAGYDRKLVLKPEEPLGITAMEKLLGKRQFADLLSSLIIKPAGKPVLAPESDPRPAFNTAAAAAADFKNN
jgi:hypothetical protein